MIPDSTSTNGFLLHTCCAPCACSIIEALLSESVCLSIFFYNPNIDLYDEYLQRKSSVITYARKKNIEFIDADYAPEEWLSRVKGLENEPERGKRCSACFDLRLEKTALYAHEHGFKVFATTNGIGRWKDIQQVNDSGHRAASLYPGLTFMDRNWRKGGAALKAAVITKAEGFFRQKYCGCIYSKKRLESLKG
jgi:hypothetical protein